MTGVSEITEVDQLSAAQKARLCLGGDNWRTAGVPEAGIEPVALSDGPHGLRKQTGEFPGPGLPATCFPTASALGSCWDTDLVSQQVGFFSHDGLMVSLKGEPTEEPKPFLKAAKD